MQWDERQAAARRNALQRAASEQWFNRQTNYPYNFLLAGLLAIFVAMLWLTVWARSYSPEDRRMLAAARQINGAIESYFQDNLEFPASLEQVRGAADPGSWPNNPYTGQPLADCGHSAFKPGCAGMVHYQQIAREGVEGWRLHVFGLDRELRCYRGAFRVEK